MKRFKIFLILYLILLLAGIVNIVLSWGDTVSQIGAWLLCLSATSGAIGMGIQLTKNKAN
jgi:hypothetical protein